MIESDIRPDLSDLDLLDDAKRHAYCMGCYPDHRPLSVVVGLCGKRFVLRETGRGGQKIPPNPCRECLRLWAVPGLCEHS